MVSSSVFEFQSAVKTYYLKGVLPLIGSNPKLKLDAHLGTALRCNQDLTKRIFWVVGQESSCGQPRATDLKEPDRITQTKKMGKKTKDQANLE